MNITELPELSSRQQEEAAQKIQAHCDAVGNIRGKKDWAKIADDMAATAIREGWRSREYKEKLNEALAAHDLKNAQSIYVQPGDSAMPSSRGGEMDFGRAFFQHGARAVEELRNGGKKTVSFTIPNVSRIRAIGSTADYGGGVQHLGAPIFSSRRLTVMDLIMAGTTSQGSVIYPRENSFTPTAGTTGEAGAKNEQNFDVSPITETVRKITAYTTVTSELLEDTPASENYITSRLGLAVEIATEAQILRGDAIGNNMRGIFSTGGVQTRAYATDGILSIRKAISDIEINTEGFYATGIVISAADWETVETQKDLDGNYLVGNVFVRGEMGEMVQAPSLWGKPVVVSKAVAAGTVYVGDWSHGAQFLRRSGVHIELSNQHADNFTRNLVTILCETRGVICTHAPGAFLELTGWPARS